MDDLLFSKDGNGKILLTPENCFYLFKNIKVLTHDYTDSFIIQQGEICTTYEQGGASLTHINGFNVNSDKVNYSDIELSTGKNLFNKNNIITGKGIHRDGFIVDRSDWTMAYIPVVSGSIYSFNHNNNVYSNSMIGAFVFCDNTGTIQSFVDMSTLPDSQDGFGKTVTIPNDISYVAKNVKMGTDVDYIDTMQFELGNTCTFYEPYYFGVQSIQGYPIRAFISDNVKPEMKIQIPLNILFLGDSITANTATNKYITEITNRIEFKSLNNFAQSGATWSHTTETKYNVDNAFPSDDNVIYNEINKLIVSVNNGYTPIPDVIVIPAGTNDFSRPLGDPTTVFSSKTFNPAVNEILDVASAVRYDCELIWKSFPNCQIILATPLQKGIENNTIIFEIGNVIKECAKYLSVKVIDQALESGIYGMFDIDEHKYLSDNLHLSALGAEKVGKFFAKELINKIEL